MKVMLIEDDNTMVSLLSILLEMEGFTVVAPPGPDQNQILSAIGANCIEMTAEEHDRIIASTSHLPFLLSSALACATPKEFTFLAGPGFRSTIRLAGTPWHMMMGILESNRDNVLNAIQSFRNSLDDIESALQNENYAELENLLDQSRSSYHLVVE